MLQGHGRRLLEQPHLNVIRVVWQEDEQWQPQHPDDAHSCRHRVGHGVAAVAHASYRNGEGVEDEHDGKKEQRKWEQAV